MDEGSEAVIWLMPVLSHAEVSIGGGENKDRTLAYTNVVRDIRQVGIWNGGERTLHIPLSLNASTHDAVAVILQGRDHGQVFAATLIRPEL